MKRLTFRCKFLTEVVLNANAATEGNNRTLDYIPGSAFIGITAQNYDSFGDEAITVFHSGKVRFGDAHLASQSRSIKVPASFFVKKGEELVKSEILVHHCISTEKKQELRKGSVQIKQQRTGFMEKVNDEWQILSTKKDFTIKSAYDREQRRSKEGQMFGYEYIAKGLEWEFFVDIDDDAAHISEKIRAELTGLKKLGRSKSAQFGLVKIDRVKEEVLKATEINTEGKLVIYAESSLSFVNEAGIPTYTPQAADFGVEGEIKWSESQVLTRVFAPWNQKRFARDCDRICIDKGSVIVIESTGKVDSEKLSRGVGLYLNEGFGRVIVNPEFLIAKEEGYATIRFRQADREIIRNNEQITASEKVLANPLIKFLEASLKKEEKDNKILCDVDDFIKTNYKRYSKIKPSQWGGIRERASVAGNTTDLLRLLFKEVNTDNKKEFSGYLMHGVAAADWQEGGRCKILKTWIENQQDAAPEATIVLAAAMAKKYNNKRAK